jgi:hypothetical protein
MKNEFIGFYNPTETEINESWSKGSFAFDANTLLNLYRYTELTRKDFIGALKTIKDRLFLPYQSAYEYHSNRISVIEGLDKSYLNLLEIINHNYEKILKGVINQFKKHPSIIVDKIFKLYEEYLDKVKKELDRQKKNHPDFRTKDEILNELTELFKNHIGDKFSNDDLNKIYSDGKVRYSESIPPGYKDLINKQNKDDRHLYGDLIIWNELINYSKKVKKPLIFVTDDRKEDWWTIENGKTIRPREELIKEFYDLTEIRILIYNADHFLQYAKEKKLVPQLKDDTIKEIKGIRVSDENIYLGSLPVNPAYAPALNAALGIGTITNSNSFSTISELAKAGIFTTNTGYGTTIGELSKMSDIFRANPNIATAISELSKTSDFFKANPNIATAISELSKTSDIFKANPNIATAISELSKTPDIITANPNIATTVSDMIKKEGMASVDQISTTNVTDISKNTEPKKESDKSDEK